MKKVLLLFACLTFLSMQVFAQRTVTGTVTSADDGMGLPGVSVVVKGTSKGTITDMNGTYSIEVPADAATLIFQFMGMETQEVEVTGDVVNAVMQSSDIAIDDIVVTALGITREKKSLGYSVQDVKGDELTQAKETNIVNSLQGRVSGAQITSTSGAVGASSRIVLRGTSSLSQNNQPLFVVDGIPIDNSTFGSTGNEGTNRGNGAADVNPDDIESVSVLKGPNAAALYGSRASNGAIIITTKSGKNQKGLGIVVSNSTTFEKPLRLPDYQNSYGQGSQGAFSFVDGAGGGVNDGFDESWGPKLDIGLMIPQFNSPVDANGVREATPWVSNPDNIKNFFETGITTSTNVAFMSGNENGSFRVSFTQLNQKGIVPNTDIKRKTVAFNGTARLSDRLTVSASGNYVNSGSDNTPGYGYDGNNVMQQFVWFGRQVDLAALKNYKNSDGSKYSWNYNYHNNPYFTLHENLGTYKRDRLIGKMKAEYKVTDWLSMRLSSGGDIYTHFNTTRRAMGDMDNPTGFYSEETYTFREFNTEFVIRGSKSFGDFDVDLSIAGNRMDRTIQDVYGSAPELAIEGVYNVANSSVAQITTNYGSQVRTNSAYIFGQFSYKNALFLDFSYRMDWSSTLPTENLPYKYPGVTLAADLTELFGLGSDILSFAKIRTSYAEVGGDTGPYRLAPTVSFGSGWNASTKLLNTFIPNELANAGLKPETSKSFELGADVRLFNNRVGLDVTYYNNKTIDQILSAPVSAASGFTTKVINAGRVDNEGVELMLSGDILRNPGGLNWTMRVNFAKNNNTVRELTEGVDRLEIGGYWSLDVMAIPGSTYGSLFGYDYVRSPDGQIVHEDGVPMQGDLKVLGNYTPDWIGGISNEFSYKGVSMSFLIDMRKGGDLYSMTTTWGRYAGILEETLIGREGGIVGDGVMMADDGTYVPNNVVVDAETYNKAAYVNDIAAGSIFDGTFVKLREIKLGYTFKKIGNTPFKDVNISLVGRNLAILYTTVPHIDPETAFSNGNLQGLEFGQLPSTRSYGFSVSFKL
jgi:TonB-linked SusC/RagA family outer membrane protein